MLLLLLAMKRILKSPSRLEDLHLGEVLDIVNNLDQTILGGGIGGRDEAEEEEALELQRRIFFINFLLRRKVTILCTIRALNNAKGSSCFPN